MKRLLLLRHAKSVPAGADIDDHERDLTARGVDDAPSIGRYISKQNFVPDLALVSSARRAVRTADLALAEVKGTGKIEFGDELYLAEPRSLLAAIRKVSDKVETLLVVGHNPGLEQLASQLAREPVTRKERDRFDLVEEKFPTAALAVLQFDVNKWREVATKQGALIDFVRPRDL